MTGETQTYAAALVGALLDSMAEDRRVSLIGSAPLGLGAGAPQHSHSPHAMLWNAPGLEIVVPSTAADVYGLVRNALASPNPTVIFSHAKVLGIEGPVAGSKAPLPFGRADIKREGKD